MSINDDLSRYPVYALSITGEIIQMPHIKTTGDYNHLTHHIHHYIRQGAYARNKWWYDKRGIKQKLFLVPIFLHEQIHHTAVKNLKDEEFQEKFHISRWDLVFNRKFSKY